MVKECEWKNWRNRNHVSSEHLGIKVNVLVLTDVLCVREDANNERKWEGYVRTVCLTSATSL